MNWFHLSLAALMLVTGSINTLSVKWADTMTSESTDGKRRGFNHPFMQVGCNLLLDLIFGWIIARELKTNLIKLV